MNLYEVGAKAILTTCKLDPSEVRLLNLDHVIRAMDRNEITDPNQQAYVLATVAHECSFLCIREIRAKAGTAVWKMQEKYWNTNYFGRGFAQLTWKKNYEKFTFVLNKYPEFKGIDLVSNPDELLKPDVSAEVLTIGMRDGLFTGVGLGDFITAKRVDFLGARKIVNGTFMADKVKTHAVALAQIL